MQENNLNSLDNYLRGLEEKRKKQAVTEVKIKVRSKLYILSRTQLS